MEQNSHPEALHLLEVQIRENYGKVVYSHKTQEKCADILSSRDKRLKNFQIILSALITTGLLVRIFQGIEWALTVSTILSAILFGLTSYLKEYSLGETIQKHESAALELWEIREKYFSLLVDMKVGLLLADEIILRRDILEQELSKTYKGAPRTLSKAYKKAQQALQLREELTFSDSEIDSFLPAKLRMRKM